MTPASDRGAPHLRISVAGAVDDVTVGALRDTEGLDIVGPTVAADVVLAATPTHDHPWPVTIQPTAAALRHALIVGAADLGAANRVLTALARAASDAPWPADVRLAAPPAPILGVAHPVPRAVATAGGQLVAVDADDESVLCGSAAEVDALVTTHRPLWADSFCAVSLAAGPDRPALTVIARAFEDAVAWDVAAAIAAQPVIDLAWPVAGARPVELVVFGAHLRGGSLSHQLTDLGARWAGELTTARHYRMRVLPTSPAKPGVLRVGDGEPGAALHGQRWLMSAAALGRFLAALPAPMQLGKVEFDDGTWRTAFGCDASAATGNDVSAYGSWPAAVAAGAVPETGRP